MAGKKGSKTDARTPTRTNGASDRSILDQARAITATGRSVLGLPSGLEPMALAPPEPSHAIQEQNLKAALEASSIFVETLESDGALAVEEIEREVAFLSPYIQREVLHHGRGFTSEAPIALPSKVTPEVLQLLLQYCRFHRASGRSDKERKMFDEKFVRLDTRRLCELTSAADALDMKPLVDLTSRALARLIEGKTPEQIRAQFQLPDDLTEEEKLEPVRNFGDDPKIRLLNRLYEKKRKELQRRREEEENLKKGDSILALEGGPPAGGSPQPDARSLDDLLSFIDGSADKGASKGTKKKRGKGGRKQPQVPPPLSNGHRASAGSNGKGDPPVSSSQNGGPAGGTKPDQAPAEVQEPEQAPPVAPDDSAKAKMEASREQSAVNGGASGLQKHWSGESAGGTSYEEGGEEEEGTLDDIDEEDEGEGEAAGGSWQVQQEELLMHSASFGPILGPITTLTSLANFKARSLPTPRDAGDSPARVDTAAPPPAAGSAESRAPTPRDDALMPIATAAAAGKGGSRSNGGSSKDADAALSTAQTEKAVNQQSASAHQEAQGTTDSGCAAATGEAAPGPDSAAGRSQALSVSKDAQSSKAPSDELQASAKAELGRQEAALQLRFGTKGLPSGNSACGLARLLDCPCSTSGSSPSEAALQPVTPSEPPQPAAAASGLPDQVMPLPAGSEAGSAGKQKVEVHEQTVPVHSSCTNRCGDAKNSVRHKAWGNPGDVAAAQHAMLAFLERCGLSRQLTLVPVEQLPPDQATEDCSATVHRGDGDVIQDVVLPNGSTLHLSLTRAAR